MQTQTSDHAKPAYLGLLNAISLAESRAGVYLRAWADASDDPDFACVLRLVAARETSHGDLFCRRISELGFSLREKSDPDSLKRLATLADPTVCDLDKLPPVRARAGGDPFKEINQRLAAGEFDSMTANMLAWYIEEERDSAARLEEAYACVRAKANGARKANGHAAASSPDSEAIIACMTAGFSKLEKSLEKLGKSLK